MQVKPTPTLGREAAPAETPELGCAISPGQPRPAGCRHRASWRQVELRGARLLPLPAHPGPALALPPQHHLQVQAAMMVCGGHKEDDDMGHACALPCLEREQGAQHVRVCSACRLADAMQFPLVQARPHTCARLLQL